MPHLFYYSALFLTATLSTGLVGAVSVQQDLYLTAKENETLNTFRDLVEPLLYKDYMNSDIYLLRWLRAKNFNLNAAEEMLKANLRWRQDNNMDDIQSEDFQDMFQDFPATVDTQDKEGRPIVVLDMHSWDIRNAVLSGKSPRLLRYFDMLMDNITLQIFQRQQEGHNVTSFKALSNAENFNMVTHGCILCIPAIWIPFVGSLENHFPGWMDQFIIIEAPEAVQIVIAILKPFLSPQTQNALRVFSANKRQWMEYVDFRISKEQRRPAYGGTKPIVK